MHAACTTILEDSNQLAPELAHENEGTYNSFFANFSPRSKEVYSSHGPMQDPVGDFVDRGSVSPVAFRHMSVQRLDATSL